MSAPALLKWRHFADDIILCAVRWYLLYALSYRDEEELLRERGGWVDHTSEATPDRSRMELGCA
jgi:transposase-like protein